MSKFLKPILKFLNDSKYLTAKCILQKNSKIQCETALLGNGLKLKEQLQKQWINISPSWVTQWGDEYKPLENPTNNSQMLFLQNIEFQNLYQQIKKQNIVNLTKSLGIRKICHDVDIKFSSEENLFYDTPSKTLLVNEYFLAAENSLSRFYNLQRERKIWWMRFSSNASRYSVEPFDLCFNNKDHNELNEKSKSITIRANFPFGSHDMECITLVPLHELNFLNSSYTEKDSLKVSMIRSVINLELTTCALILDASESSIPNRHNTLMLNRKLAPYQVLLATLHKGNKIVDELALHLQHVISKSGIRLYDNSIPINIQTELERKLMDFDSLGIPYAIVLDDESIKTGLIRLRSRDTTLYETIHISDITDYLIKIFNY